MSFRPGQHVRVALREHAGHHRTPTYLKGKTGTIARVHGAFTNPETRAYGTDGLPKQTLYQVRFEQDEAAHTVFADIFEHWLDPA